MIVGNNLYDSSNDPARLLINGLVRPRMMLVVQLSGDIIMESQEQIL